ncbi:ion channel [Pseudogemmobacter sp. W21_MBD1_M6]|uniref:ion channel n=1 Tax=Pseudogemmobacter sp. W21_MBD1_M6 TaxID=3240271 RepID=UPI003F9B1399
MLIQIALGTLLMMISIIIAGTSFWLVEYLMGHMRPWLNREPHRPKLMLVLCLAAVWILGLVTIGVWIWAFAFWFLGVFVTMEASVYFSLVAFTTLGFGDILLPQEWRLLAGMAAANGLLNMGLLTVVLVEVMRHVRIGQVEEKKKHRGV